MKKWIRILVLTFGLPFVLISQQKIVLIEEFTNYNCVSCANQTKILDSVLKERSLTTKVLKYHINIPNQDPFYNPGVEQIKTFYDIKNSTPSIVLDGVIRPKGPFQLGSSGNITTKLIDSLSLLDPKLYFFGTGHVFQDGYRKMDTGGGAHSLGEDLQVYYTRALVEQVINLSEPTSITGEVAYDYVFRGFIFFRKPINLPKNGSHHSADLISIDKNKYNLDQLGVMHYISDADGKILNAVYDPPFNVNEYSINTKNTTKGLTFMWQNELTPSMSVVNDGVFDVSDLSIVLDINGDKLRDTINVTIPAGDSINYVWKTIKLGPGKKLIKTYVENYNQSVVGGLIKNNLNVTKHYIFGNHAPPNEAFENYDNADSIGLFMDLTQNPFVFKNVSSAKLNTTDSIGGFGKSDRAMIIDFWNWKYDFNTPSNNKASLLYGEFSLSNMLSPKLVIDVSCAGNSALASGNLTLEVKTRTKSKEFKIIPASFITQPKIDKMYIPTNKSKWQKLSIDLIDFIGEDNISITFKALATTSPSSLNSLYLDNFRVEDDIFYCLENGYAFYTQSQLDSFLIEHMNCNTIKGDICIGACGQPNIVSDITNLDALSKINYLKGSLTLSTLPLLEKMPLLENLIKIEGDFIIDKCPKLKNVQGFTNLKTIGGTFRISENETLSSLAGFTNLKKIGHDFIIKNTSQLWFNTTSLSKLDSIDGSLLFSHLSQVFTLENLKNLRHIGKNFELDSCTKISSITLLPQIDTIIGNLAFKNLSLLQSLNYFPNIQHVGGDLIIVNCPLLPAINEFSKLKSINGNFILNGCKSISSILGLSNLKSINGRLDWSNLDALKNIEPLSNLSFIGHNIQLKNLKELASTKGLEKISIVNGSLIITENEKMSSLTGLDNINVISESLNLSRNQSLKNLFNLKNLVKVLGTINIQENNLLNDINGLANVDSDSLLKYGQPSESKLTISENKMLKVCNNKLVCSLISKNHNIVIQNNQGDCESLNAVESACTNAINEKINFKYNAYPVPASNLLYLTLNEKVNYSIYNTDGRKIRSGILYETKTNELDISSLLSGIYYIHIYGRPSIKFVKI